jgi:pilus assembly protein Flp/PilA
VVQVFALKFAFMVGRRWEAGMTKLVEASCIHLELSMKNLVARFAKDESGATAIEYGLIAAGIALAIITVVNNLGSTLNTKFGSISTSLK